MPYPDRHAYPDRFYPVVDSVAWVARLALLGVGTIQLRAKNLNEADARQAVTDALEMTRGTPAKLVVNDYWRAAIVAGAKHLHLGQEDLADLADAVDDDLVVSGRDGFVEDRARVGGAAHNHAGEEREEVLLAGHGAADLVGEPLRAHRCRRQQQLSHAQRHLHGVYRNLVR